MSSSNFYQKCVGDLFWLPQDHFISVERYDSALHAYHIYFENAYGIQFYLLDFDEIKLIVRSLKNRFGVKSHSYCEWKSFLHDIKVNKLLDRMDNLK